MPAPTPHRRRLIPSHGLAAGSHTVTVKDANGCTKSDSITVDPCVGFCSLTQGAYGNPGGIFTSPDSCYNGLGTLALIQALLGDTAFMELRVAKSEPDPDSGNIVGTKSLTIPLSAAQCIMNRLPANGTPDALPNQIWRPNAPNSPNCQVPGPKLLPIKNGKFANVLLGQTITLGLNLRLDPTLADLDLTTIGTPGGTGRGAYREFCTTRWRSHPDWYFAGGHRRDVKSHICPRPNASRQGFRSAGSREPGVGWTVRPDLSRSRTLMRWLTRSTQALTNAGCW